MYQALILMGAISPDHKTVTLTPEEFRRLRANRR